MKRVFKVGILCLLVLSGHYTLIKADNPGTIGQISARELKWAIESGIESGIREWNRTQSSSFLSALSKNFGAGISDMMESVVRSADEVFMNALSEGLPIEEARKKAMQRMTEGLKEVANLLGDTIKSFFDATGIDITSFLIKSTIGSAALYGGKKIADFAYEYYILRMNTPKLVQKILTPAQITKDMNDLLYTGDTERKLKRVIKTAKGVVDNKYPGILHKINPWKDTSKGRAQFENTMLWGPPGTGKTAIAEVIAKEAGMNFFGTSGSDFAKLRGKDLQQIDVMFQTMRKASRPSLLFIDEMENLFGARGAGMSEESRQILTKLMAETGEPSNQIMMIGATNRPEDIDEAMLRRFPVKIQVAYPSKEGRIKLFKIYKGIYFDKDKAYTKQQHAEINKVLTDATLKDMEQQMGEISPAEINNIMNTLKNRSLTDNKGIPTLEIIAEVISDKKEQIAETRSGFKRKDLHTIVG